MKINDKIDNIFSSIRERFPQAFNFDLFKVLYLLFFLILYISNQHSVEKKIREISILEKEVEELRTIIEFNNNYMFSRKNRNFKKSQKFKFTGFKITTRKNHS